MSNSSYEMLNPSCNYGLSIYCHTQSLPRGLRAPNEKGYCDDPRSLDLIGRRQPRRDYASGQCLAMLRRNGVTGATAEVGEGTNRKSHNQNMEQKQKVMGREGKEKILLKNGNNVHFSLFTAGF